MLLLLLLFKEWDNYNYTKMFKNNNYTISSELKYKPDTAQLLHQVHMMSHITNVLPPEVLVLGACDVIQPAI